ncbi:S41 family peptidase [Mycoplasma zalophidermidis]|uniref:S41 family peptidase n=1 Tax=Mycoplasma zalophidermidis TaxID=398174 RepID=UPI00215D3CBA|nr:S41 family peptidase [Mycoplasma zalophidermidis]MCR8966365.1 S41 family peptidase [Mycoplasma zalophidermidis]
MRRNNKNKIKLRFFYSSVFASLFTIPVATISCVNISNKNEKLPNNLEFNQEFEFSNNSSEYKLNNVKIKTFKNTKNQDMYINVNEFIKKMNGVVDPMSFKFKARIGNQLHYVNGENEIIFDTKQNKILLNNLDAFQVLKSSETIDYTKWIEYLSTKVTKLADKKYSELDLGKYNMSIETANNDIYLPFSVFNLLFFSQNYYNIYFNGEKFVGVSTVINKDIDPKEYNLIMNSVLNNKMQTEKFRINSYNFILFVFDNFYGLRGKFLEENNVKNFDEYFTKNGLKEQLLSINIADNTSAYESFFYEHLNELHSSIQSGSYYHPENYRANPYGATRSQKVNEYIAWLGILKKIRSAVLSNHENKFVSFHDDTAIIYLDQFVVGSNDNLMKGAKHEHDSFEKMYKAIELIRQNQTPIKKIILDLSLNGGGSIAAMEKVAGFLTNKDQQIFFYETINKQLSYSKYRVDVNKDGQYDMRDGYPNYKWYILTGINTFSAANLLAHIAKTSKLATIIGNRSGGGMYSILPIVLPDGTSLEISSNNAWIAASKQEIADEDQLPYTQNGVAVDIEIPYLAYMNYDVISAYIRDPKKGKQEYDNYLRSTKISAWKNEAKNIEKYLKFINKKKRKEYQIEIENNKIMDQDSLERMEEKIEKMKSIFRFVEHLYNKEFPNP